ncbi:Uncharacterised protein [Xylophilus ampelinus]|nr:Uncharacterised protein [Xylophilus ampelinus]
MQAAVVARPVARHAALLRQRRKAAGRVGAAQQVGAGRGATRRRCLAGHQRVLGDLPVQAAAPEELAVAAFAGAAVPIDGAHQLGRQPGGGAAIAGVAQPAPAVGELAHGGVLRLALGIGLRAHAGHALPQRQQQCGHTADAQRGLHHAVLHHACLDAAPGAAGRRARGRRPTLPVVGLEAVDQRGARGDGVEQLAVQARADLIAELEVAFPLRLAEELVGGGFLRKAGMRGLEVHQVDRQVGRHVGFDQHDAPAPAAGVTHARQGQAGLALHRRQVVERTEGVHERALHAGARLHEGDVGAEVDAGAAHQVLEVAEAIGRVGAAIGQHDQLGLLLQQRVGAGVLEVAAVAEEPIRLADAGEDAEALAQHEARLGQRRAPPGFGRLPGHRACRPPVAQAQAGEQGQRRHAAVGHAAQARRQRGARHGRPPAQREGALAFGHGLPVAARGLCPAAGRDRHGQALAVAVELAAARIQRVVHAHVDQVHRATGEVRPVAVLGHVVVGLCLAHSDAAAVEALDRLDRRAAQALPVGGAQVGTHDARLVEHMQRRQVEEADVAPAQQRVTAHAEQQQPPPDAAQAEVQPLRREHRQQQRGVQHAHPPRDQAEAQHDAQQSDQAEHQVAAERRHRAAAAGDQRQHGAHRRGRHGQRQAARRASGAVGVLRQPPGGGIHQPQQAQRQGRSQQQRQPARGAVAPGRGVEGPPQRPQHPERGADPTERQSQRGRHEPGRRSVFPVEDGPEEGDGRGAQRPSHQPRAGAPRRPRARPVAQRPVGIGQHHGGRPQQQHAGPQHGQQRHGTHHRGRDALGTRIDGAGHEAPGKQVDAAQHQAEQGGGDGQLDVRGQQVAQEQGRGEEHVAQAARDQIAAVAAQPLAEAHALEVGEGRLHGLCRGGPGTGCRRVRGREAVAQPAPDRSGVTAARDGRQQVEAQQLPLLRQRLEQPEAEGRAADAAARQGQAPGAARGAAAAVGAAAGEGVDAGAGAGASDGLGVGTGLDVAERRAPIGDHLLDGLVHREILHAPGALAHSANGL